MKIEPNLNNDEIYKLAKKMREFDRQRPSFFQFSTTKDYYEIIFFILEILLAHSLEKQKLNKHKLILKLANHTKLKAHYRNEKETMRFFHAKKVVDFILRREKFEKKNYISYLLDH